MTSRRAATTWDPNGTRQRGRAVWSLVLLACATTTPVRPDGDACRWKKDPPAVHAAVARWLLEQGRAGLRELGVNTEMTSRERQLFEHCSRDAAAEAVMDGLLTACPHRPVPESEARAWARTGFRRCAARATR